MADDEEHENIKITGNESMKQSSSLQQMLNSITKERSKPSFSISGEKLIGMGSDGASNMTGIKSGLSTLLRENISKEIVNVHCLCHRLELSFRDVFKKVKVYDKMMTLLIRLYYFFNKSYKNKHSLQNAFKVVGKGLLLPKVTGTRWLAHVYRAITALLRSYKALEMTLSTASHKNPKAEGLVKIMLDKNVMAFILLLQDILNTALRLSLKLQQDNVTLSDSICWVEATLELIEEKKTSFRENEALRMALDTGKYDDITLKGAVPSMTYAESIFDGLNDAIKRRFSIETNNVFNATKVLNFLSWPLTGNELQGFGNGEIKLFMEHFSNTLQMVPSFCPDEVLPEWSFLKKLTVKRYGKNISTVCWNRVLQESDMKNIAVLVDLMLTLPPTSVRCETAFSQLKLLKTCRRSRLGQGVLNDLMAVKLLSPSVLEFNPDSSIQKWQVDSCGRRTSYKRLAETQRNELKVAQADKQLPDIVVNADMEINIDIDDNDNEIDSASSSNSVIQVGRSFMDQIELLCDKEEDDDIDDECHDYQDEDFNFVQLLFYSRN